MASMDNSYVIGIFDTCREAFCNIFPPVSSRGGTYDEEHEEVVERGRNLFKIFYCDANKGGPATSTMGTVFFERLEQAKAENGCILIPDFSSKFSRFDDQFQVTWHG